jgi:hypothetical protein
MLRKWGKKVAVLGWYEIQMAFYRALPPDTVVFNSRYGALHYHFMPCQDAERRMMYIRLHIGSTGCWSGQANNRWNA